MRTQQAQVNISHLELWFDGREIKLPSEPEGGVRIERFSSTSISPPNFHTFEGESKQTTC